MNQYFKDLLLAKLVGKYVNISCLPLTRSGYKEVSIALRKIYRTMELKE